MKGEVEMSEDIVLLAPLAGQRVVELADGIAGPYCAQMLADLGAQVTKVELPEGDPARQWSPPFVDGDSAVFMALNRGKRSVVADYRTVEGQDLAARLIAGADVVVEHLGPGAAERYNLGYPQLAEGNPRLVWCALSYFGEKGPWAQRPGSELTVQAASGIMRYLGEPGKEPVRVGADMSSCAAATFAVQGILAALWYRGESGVGQRVSVSLLGAMEALKSSALAGQNDPDKWEGFHVLGVTMPPQAGYRTADGRATMELNRPDREKWVELCRRLGLNHLIDDPDYTDWQSTLAMHDRAQEKRPIYEAATSQWKSQELVDLVRSLGGLGSTFNTYPMLFEDEQAKALATFVEAPAGARGLASAFNSAIRIDGRAPALVWGVPRLGEHTAAVLAELGQRSASEPAREGAR